VKGTAKKKEELLSGGIVGKKPASAGCKRKEGVVDDQKQKTK